eukprot:g3278.t1
MPAAASTSAATTPVATPSAQTDALGVETTREAQIRVSHVCFDEYIEDAGRQRRPSGNDNILPSGIGMNPDPLDNGDESAEANLATEMAPSAALAAVSEDGARLWREGRQAALAEVEALASARDATAASAADRSSPNGRQCSLSSKAASAVRVVLVDDNLHFRTMRHKVFSLARKYECGYAQVYFPVEVEEAVGRNEARGSPVSEAVIRKMAGSIQPPDPKRFKWERHTAVVGGHGDRPNTSPRGCRGSAMHGRDGAGRKMDVRDESGVQRSFWRVVIAAAADEDMMIPSSPLSPTAGLLQREADREATRDSLLHRFDLELRESAKRVAKGASDARLSSDLLRKVMQACSSSRKIAMRRAKAAGNQNGARQAGPSDASSSAAFREREERGGASTLSRPNDRQYPLAFSKR